MSAHHYMDLDDLQASSTSTCRGKPRQRSAVACQICHTRRIKCDAVAKGLPCSSCERTGQRCRLIDSKRHRKKTRPASSAFRNPPSPVTSVGSINTTSAALRSSPTAAQINDRLPNLPLDTEDCHDMHQLASDGPETLYAQVLENAASPGERANTTLRLASQICIWGKPSI